MNKSNENIEPKTDLELSLNYSNHCAQKDLNDDSGAGANAASRVDMSFAATCPVSELVWSPEKGLRLKCAEPSFTDKKTSLYRDVGPSNVLHSAQGKTGVLLNPHKHIDEVNSPHHDNGAECIGEREETDTTIGLSVLRANQKGHTMEIPEKDISVQPKLINSGAPEKNDPQLFVIPGQVDKGKPDDLLLKAEETSTDLPTNEQCCGNNGTVNKIVVANNIVGHEIQHEFRHEASSTPVTSSGRLPLEKMESTAENELQAVEDETSPAAAGKIAISMSSCRNENGCQENALVLKCDKNSLTTCCETSSRTHGHSKKGKGKVLSDEDADERNSIEDDDSHESVESCNSAGLFSTGKRQWNFNKQQSGSKRVKHSFQETKDSPSSIRRDSSFMSWISNMMKGFSHSRQVEVTPPARTFEHSNNDLQILNQKPVITSNDPDPGSRSMGFQSIFQSIYTSSLKNIETRKMSENKEWGDNSMDVELGNKVTGVSPMPIACCPESGSNCKQVLLSSETFEGSTCPNEVTPLSKPEVPRNFVDQEHTKSNSLENKSSCSLGMSKEKGRITSTSYFREHKADVDADAVFEAMASPTYQKNDVCRGLWITRFSSKSTAPVLDAHHSQVSDAGCLKLPQATSRETNEDYETVESKEQSTDEKFSSETKQLQCDNVSDENSEPGNAELISNQKSTDGLKNIYSFARFKSPEAMASLFARRLDALKHNVPPNLEDNPARANMTCFFCGVKGHQFHYCAEISGNRGKDLPNNMIRHEKLEVCPYMHAELSEVNPNPSEAHGVFLSGKHELQVSTINHNTPCGMNVNSGNEDNAMQIAYEEGQCQSPTDEAVKQTLKEGIYSGKKSNRLLTYEKLGFPSSTPVKFVEKARSRSGNTEDQQVSDVPKGIFEGIKKLQLSRSDILKWINSPMSASLLDGFFLRLRLGKWEEGLGGTGYHVASITGSHRQSLVQNAKNSVSVNVRGVTCLVESQYISNHDFLEEELMEWWSTTSKGGDSRLPSEQDLIERIKMKESFGF